MMNETKNYLLAIYINEYVEPQFNRLKGPGFDVKEIVDVLIHKYDFEQQNITILHSPAEEKSELATSDNIIRALKGYQKLPENSNLIIYFAGHGKYLSDFECGYWISYDAVPDSLGRAGWVSQRDVVALISNIKNPKHILIISDSCFSGSFMKRDFKEVPAIDNLDKVDWFTSREVLTSCGVTSDGAYELADDSALKGHSSFAYWLIEFLKKPTSDRFVTQELFTYLFKSVKGQQPTLGYLDGHDGARNASFVFKYKSPINNPEPKVEMVKTEVSPIGFVSNKVEDIKEDTEDVAFNWNELIQEYQKLLNQGKSISTLLQVHPEILPRILKPSKTDNPAILFFLGLVIEKGLAPEYENDKAVLYFRKASESGIVVSSYHLARCAEIGKGMKQNLALARTEYQKACDQGFAPALFSYGVFLLKQIETVVSAEAGLELIEQAAALGNIHASSILARRKFLDPSNRINVDTAIKEINNHVDGKSALAKYYIELIEGGRAEKRVPKTFKKTQKNDFEPMIDTDLQPLYMRMLK